MTDVTVCVCGETFPSPDTDEAILHLFKRDDFWSEHYWITVSYHARGGPYGIYKITRTFPRLLSRIIHAYACNWRDS